MSINKVSESNKNSILRKSAQTLPNRPTEQGYTAEEIKQRFYKPIVDSSLSVISEIDRVVEEVNEALSTKDTQISDFIEASKISENFKKTFSSADWVLNPTSRLYELTIGKAEHKVEDYKEIRVTMYIIDGDGEFQQVNQYKISTSGIVTAYSDAQVAGCILVGRNVDGYIVSSFVTDVNLIQGLKDVAKTGSYNDLVDKPNLSLLTENETYIANIISGSQKVGASVNSDNATNATYSSTSGYATSAGNSAMSDKAKADEDGVNLKAYYTKNNGTYPNMTAGTAQKAQNDEDGVNIKEQYAKKTGTYNGLTAGRAINADNAINATNATNSVNSQKATADAQGRDISNTYTTGLILERMTINVEIRVGEVMHPSSSSQMVDLFRDAPTAFAMNVLTTRPIGSNTRTIIGGNLMRQISVGANRYDKDYMFLCLPSGYEHPMFVRLTSEEYGSGNCPNAADANQTYTIDGKTFRRYNLFDESYDFNNGHWVAIEFLA